MKLNKMHWFGIISFLIIIVIDLIFFLDKMNLFYFLLGIGIMILLLPFIVGIMVNNQKEQEINSMFLEFTRNLAESVSTGTPISKSIINMRKNNYEVLNPYVQKLANQIYIGIPLSKALENFSNDVDSSVITRAIGLIKEAEKSGGEIDYILDSTAKSIAEVEKLKKERQAAIYNLVVQGYIIFFLFIGIMMIMEFKIIPLATGINIGSLSSVNFDSQVQTSNVDPINFSRPFLYLLVTQGFFAGLVIGKISEGSAKAGLKHSFIMATAAFLISTGARLLFAN
jgi:flagellar protein FlaJ